MKVSFEPLLWEDYPSINTPINAENLNRLEAGVAGLYEDMVEINAKLNGAFSEYVTDWLDEHVTPAGSAVIVDDSLTIEGAAADAKKVGNEIAAIKQSGTVKASEYLKDILSNMMLLFEAVSLYNDTIDVARIGAETNELIENLEIATLVLTGIDVVFNQTDTIYSDATLDDLKQYLTVTAMYDDGSSRTTTAYTLSGTIATGTQTFTVTLGDFTKTFDAVITKAVIDYTNFIMYQIPEETVFDGTNVIDTGIKPVSANNDYNWTIMSKLSFDGANWGKVFFGWLRASSTHSNRLSVSTTTQAGGKKFVYGHNNKEIYGESLGSSVPSGNHDVAICIVNNANDATTRFVIYYDGVKKVDSTLTEIAYYNDPSLALYLGSRHATASFIGTMHDFVMYSTIVDNDTVNTYLEE